MVKTSLAVLALLLGLGFEASLATADDTGVGQLLHSMRREGKRVCFVDHFHDGYGSGGATRKAAELAAAKAWAEFTAFEYGTDWASWVRAGSKGMDCSQASGGWSCHATARPCK